METILSRKINWAVDPFISNTIRNPLTIGYIYKVNPFVSIADFFDPGYLFFCQADDGIRVRNVTGVQTCALPISYIRWLQIPGSWDFRILVGICSHRIY